MPAKKYEIQLPEASNVFSFKFITQKEEPTEEEKEAAAKDPNIVKTTSNLSLNSKLYAKLISCLEGSALQSIVARTHLHCDGLSVLHDLFQTHQSLQIPEDIAAKTV